jgi:UDP-N-acetyl-D-galactosamine dehydrogenase
LTIAVVGLGYVGLPLGLELGKKHCPLGFVLPKKKIAAYKRREMGIGKITDKLAPGGMSNDLKSVFDPDAIRSARARLWRL